jgi:hypothetical protein
MTMKGQADWLSASSCLHFAVLGDEATAEVSEGDSAGVAIATD